MWRKQNIKIHNKTIKHHVSTIETNVADETILKLFNASLIKTSSIPNTASGDFFPSWDEKQMKMKPQPTTCAQCFINMLSDLGAVQLKEEPTRQDNTLDLIVTNSTCITSCVEEERLPLQEDAQKKDVRCMRRRTSICAEKSSKKVQKNFVSLIGAI